ncbi:GMP synthase-Glutamine amidotransferase [Rubritalea squalenifaciens DSM 18772]|uniref:GMP synthase-Glutamine amidotransferase n=1 Tax=Rubritalea squalenifaciens DSM 18772 TaxID=1123071 RepID=A0A1M6N6T4_9BACT|nr:gamma-glutamyl-gamma-aminobutyrate hydrolase family protein [Rubritalea squalenifaciens]SHJ91455.1 GMP synthase-Glutamine amidotransferase [Rubritalea squalenifaciens DSM 18772]
MITLGLLQCDDIADPLQPEHGNYPAMFAELFKKVDPDIRLRIYDVRQGEYPQDLSECCGYLSTGSQHGMGDGLAWVDKLLEFIRELNRAGTPYFGICFGHQALACALGGAVELSTKGWGVGVSFNNVIARKEWMSPVSDQLDIIVSHQDQITRLPEGAEVLAESLFCPYYMIQVGKHMASVQGHPEFTPAYSRALMDRRRDRIPPNRIREAEASLSAHVDSLVLAQWIVNFLTK